MKGMQLAALAAIGGLGLAACGPTAPSRPIVTTTPPLGANAAIASGGSMMGQPGAPPVVDRYGQPNYDSQGNYNGAHGIGTLVDNPDQPAPPQTPSDMVRADQQNIDDSMCKSIRAGDPNAAC